MPPARHRRLRVIRLWTRGFRPRLPLPTGALMLYHTTYLSRGVRWTILEDRAQRRTTADACASIHRALRNLHSNARSSVGYRETHVNPTETPVQGPVRGCASAESDGTGDLGSVVRRAAPRTRMSPDASGSRALVDTRLDGRSRARPVLGATLFLLLHPRHRTSSSESCRVVKHRDASVHGSAASGMG